jgi:dipeptidyl aminopeptidase/acylaminoacyl peptidase
MRTHPIILPIIAIAFFCSTPIHAQQRPLELADMFRIQRVSDPALSPDGQWVAYTLTTPDLAANATSTDIWIVPSGGGTARRLTSHPAHDRLPAWSPDGSRIMFASTRSGSQQLWMIHPDGTGEKQLTAISTDASDGVWSPDGKAIAFVSEVFPEFSALPFAESDSLNRMKLEQTASGKVRAKIITRLLYREWNSWRDGKRKHIFIQTIAGGEPRDLTPGDRDAVPFSQTFSAGIDFAFSPDGTEIAFTATPWPVREEAWRTNHDIYSVPVTGGTPRQITTNPAADGYPRYSPDGRYLVYRAQSVPDNEAGRWQLMLQERATGTIRSLTSGFDASPGPPVWSTDSRRLFFAAEKEGNEPVYTVSVAGDDVRPLFADGVNGDISVVPDGTRLLFTHTTAVRPVELYTMSVDAGTPKQITNVNDALFSGLAISPPTALWFDGAGGTRIHSWLYTPPGFDSTRRYPFIYLVHGGPQNAWLNAWSYRWNPALWAAQGYVVMTPNPRGSTGFGQKFVDEITGDWGGKVFVDLMKGLDVAEALPYVDRDRKAAAGASFGGYMMNWFQAKAGGRFKTLVTHCGTFNFYNSWGATEEIWFDAWERGGTPWENPDGYERFSPHKYLANFSTPNLVIHNELDYRVPLSDGMQLFTTLQRRGIPSKFLYFPDEGHWVLKPANSKLWHTTVFDWLAGYLTPGAGGH